MIQVDLNPGLCRPQNFCSLVLYQSITYCSWVVSHYWLSQTTGQFRILFGQSGLLNLGEITHFCWENGRFFRLSDSEGSSFVAMVFLIRVVQTVSSLGGFIIHHTPLLTSPAQAASGLLCISSLTSYLWEAVSTNRSRSRVFHPRCTCLVCFGGLQMGWWSGFSVSMIQVHIQMQNVHISWTFYWSCYLTLVAIPLCLLGSVVTAPVSGNWMFILHPPFIC